MGGVIEELRKLAFEGCTGVCQPQEKDLSRHMGITYKSREKWRGWEVDHWAGASGIDGSQAARGLGLSQGARWVETSDLEPRKL